MMPNKRNRDETQILDKPKRNTKPIARLGDTSIEIEEDQYYSVRKPGQLFKYHLNKKQSATTYYSVDNFVGSVDTSDDNKHSEMGALDELKSEGKIYINTDGEIVKMNGEFLSINEFQTPALHCGACSLVLDVLAVPTSFPTLGIGQKLYEGTYPLPDFIQKSFAFWKNLIGETAFTNWLNSKYPGEEPGEAWAALSKDTDLDIFKDFKISIFKSMVKLLSDDKRKVMAYTPANREAKFGVDLEKLLQPKKESESKSTSAASIVETKKKPRKPRRRPRH